MERRQKAPAEHMKRSKNPQLPLFSMYIICMMYVTCVNIILAYMYISIESLKLALEVIIHSAA